MLEDRDEAHLAPSEPRRDDDIGLRRAQRSVDVRG
jgi:hypothetical protein